MPYPAQVSRERIVLAASELVEQGEIDSLSLAQLAQSLGIRPPSLYRYFPNKAALILALNLDTLAQLTAVNLPTPQAQSDPRAALLAIARNYRTYAHAHPKRYLLAFSAVYTEDSTQQVLLAMALPLQQWVEQTASSDSLTHLRGLWALIHGYVVLEISRMFQRGGDLDAAFDRIVMTYLSGLASRET